MRKINGRDEAFKVMMKVAKRIGLTVLCCIPVMAIFAYLTRKIITSDALQILCFTFIMGVAVTIEELVVRAREKRKAEEIETKRDVFK